MKRRLLSTVAIPASALGLVVALSWPSHAQSVNMGTAGSFAVLAGSTVTNTGPTVLEGNLGVFPGTAIVGFPPGIVNPPYATYAGNAVAGQAQTDLTTAYNALAGLPTTVNLTGQDLGGRTLGPGVYEFNSSAQLTGPLILDAQGNPNALFVFNVGSTLTTASASSISLIGGAQGQNVFFRVGSSATLGTATSFVGDILALTSISLNTGANITCGAALARNGAVTLDTNRISIPTSTPCLAPLLPPPVVVTPPGGEPVVVPPVVTPPVIVPPIVVAPPGTVVPPVVVAPGVVVEPVVVPPGTVVPPGSIAILPDGAVLPEGTPIPPGVPVTVAPAEATITPAATVTNVINASFFEAVRTNSTLPQGFLDLATLSPVAQANALAQLAGEAGTAVAPAGIQAMNSFLRQVLNPFAGDRLLDFIGERVGPGPLVVKALGYAPVSPQSPNRLFSDPRVRGPAAGAPEPRRWALWGAAYGDHNRVDGNALAGSHDRSVSNFSIATGLDYRVTPNTVVGFAIAGGGTKFGLANGFGGGSSEMIQAAAYSFMRFGAAYVSTALAYSGHWTETDRTLTFANDRLSADFFANDVGARVEGGYRFKLQGLGSTQFGLTPYVALQGQAFWTPSYRETGSGSSPFALAYDARKADVGRTEIGAWFDHTIPLANAALVMRTRVAWAHDHYFADPTIVKVEFQSLPGRAFTVKGAEPATDFALLSLGASVKFRNAWSFDARFDGEWGFRSRDGREFAIDSREGYSRTYAGMGTLRYAW